MFNRWIENGLQDVLDKEGIGSIAFCPLSQGLLTNRYLNGIPTDSRAGKPGTFLNDKAITQEYLDKVRRLNEVASVRGQSLAQMALAWVLRKGRLTSAIIGASKVSQIEENVAALKNLEFSGEELAKIDGILK
jgi:L-glyceraldehyde 3-phosphate reductase